ncbi:MAG: hypothetical protein RLZZ234_450 [Candidatus Parcubacteria bacterium]
MSGVHLSTGARQSPVHVHGTTVVLEAPETGVIFVMFIYSYLMSRMTTVIVYPTLPFRVLCAAFLFGITGVLCMGVQVTHAASEDEKLVMIANQVEVLTPLVHSLVRTHGEVRGAATVADPHAALVLRKTAAEKARAVAAARLAALRKVASTTAAQKSEMSVLQTQKIPSLNSQIASLIKQIAAFAAAGPQPSVTTSPQIAVIAGVGTLPSVTISPTPTVRPAVHVPPQGSVWNGGAEIVITSARAQKIPQGVPVIISWKGKGTIESYVLSFISKTTGATVHQVKLPSTQTTYVWRKPSVGEYQVHIAGMAKKGVVVKALDKLSVTGGAVSPLVPMCTFTASPIMVTKGQSTTLSWMTQNASGVLIDQGVGKVALSGSKTVAPTQTTTYNLLLVGSNDREAKCSQTVTVKNAEKTSAVLRVSAADPAATTFPVLENAMSEDYAIFEFGVDATQSNAPVAIETIALDIATNNPAGVGAVIADMEMHVGGTVVDDFVVTNASARVATYTFEVDGSIVVPAGEKANIEVNAFFAPQAGHYPNGTTIRASVAAAGVVGMVRTSVTGAVVGSTHTLQANGVIINSIDATQTLMINSDAVRSDDAGKFTMTLDVTGFYTDAYVPSTAVRGVLTTNAGVNFTMVGSTNAAVATGVTTAVLSSTADKINGQYVVREGETETFTLTVTYDPTTAGVYSLLFESLNFRTSPTGTLKSAYLKTAPGTDKLVIGN